MTVRELITASLRLLGVKGSGDTLDATEDIELLVIINDLLESWATEGLMIPSRALETLTWAGGNASRTIGAAGNLVTARPIRIETAFIRDGVNDTPLEIINAMEYQAIGNKTQTAAIPEYLYYNPTVTTGTLYLWPVPSASVTLGLASFKQFTALAIGDTVALNPGYARAVRYNLAIDLAPEYGKSASMEVAMIAEETKLNLRRHNLVVPKVRFDGSLPGVCDSGFNINTGDF